MLLLELLNRHRPYKTSSSGKSRTFKVLYKSEEYGVWRLKFEFYTKPINASWLKDDSGYDNVVKNPLSEQFGEEYLNKLMDAQNEYKVLVMTFKLIDAQKIKDQEVKIPEKITKERDRKQYVRDYLRKSNLEIRRKLTQDYQQMNWDDREVPLVVFGTVKHIILNDILANPAKDIAIYLFSATKSESSRVSLYSRLFNKSEIPTGFIKITADTPNAVYYLLAKKSLEK